jgi:hypothetical protein
VLAEISSRGKHVTTSGGKARKCLMVPASHPASQQLQPAASQPANQPTSPSKACKNQLFTRFVGNSNKKQRTPDKLSPNHWEIHVVLQFCTA